MAEDPKPTEIPEPTEAEVLSIMHDDDLVEYRSTSGPSERRRSMFQFYKDQWKAQRAFEEHRKQVKAVRDAVNAELAEQSNRQAEAQVTEQPVDNSPPEPKAPKRKSIALDELENYEKRVKADSGIGESLKNLGTVEANREEPPEDCESTEPTLPLQGIAPLVIHEAPSREPKKRKRTDDISDWPELRKLVEDDIRKRRMVSAVFEAASHPVLPKQSIKIPSPPDPPEPPRIEFWEEVKKHKGWYLLAFIAWGFSRWAGRHLADACAR